jgi:hypothetical protein
VAALAMSDDFGDENQDPTPRRRTRSWESGAPTGQERTVSFESEERYWTDYLRVALPVIGLLLMLALFWWWAQQFIGDDGNKNDVAQSTRTAEVATAPIPTATATVQVQITATSASQSPTKEPAGNNGEGTPSDNGGQPGDCDFKKGDIVQVTEDGVNLRSEPDAAGDNVIVQLDAGTQLSIVDDCYVEDDAGNQYWRVRNSETAKTGYISADYITASE